MKLWNHSSTQIGGILLYILQYLKKNISQMSSSTLLHYRKKQASFLFITHQYSI